MPTHEPILLTVADKTYQARWDFCVNSQCVYAQRHQLRHVIHDEGAEGLNMLWSKLWYILHHLEKGQQVFYVDADVVITPSAPHFGDEMDKTPEKSLFMAQGISHRPNAGVMMARPTEIMKQFFRHVISRRQERMPPEDFVTETDDNGHIIHFLKESRFAGLRQELPLTWNCSRPEVKGVYLYHFTNILRHYLETRWEFAEFENLPVKARMARWDQVMNDLGVPRK